MPMNRNEKRLLREVIHSVAHHNEHAWWHLKREIFDYGYQGSYPAQIGFGRLADRAVERLPDDVKAALLWEWRAAKPARPDLPDADIFQRYARLIEEEVVSRARAAAYRTSEW